MAKQQGNRQQQPKQKRRAHGEGSVHLRKDGRWQAEMTLGEMAQENGKRKRRYFYGKTRKEALEKLHQAQHEQRQGTLVTAPQQSLQAHMEQWLQAKRLQLKDGTYAYYRIYTQTYILPAL